MTRSQVNIRLSPQELAELNQVPGGNRGEKIRTLLQWRMEHQERLERIERLEANQEKLSKRISGLIEAINSRVQVIHATPKTGARPGA